MIEIQGPDTVERKPAKMGEAELEETPAEQSDSEVEEIPAEQGDPEGEAAPSGHAAAELEDGSCPELFQNDCHDLVSEPETAERLDGEDPSDSGRGSVPDADRATDTDLVTDPDRVPDADSVANSGHGSVSDADPDTDPAAFPHAYDAERLAALLPGPASDVHKYSRGRLVVIGGAAAYPGAACLAAAASQRMGAGYTEVLCAPESVSTVRAFRPSLVVRSWEALAPSSFAAARSGRPVAYAVGSGFDAADDASEAKRLVHRALKHAHAPLLVDGGGLATLASDKGRRLMRRRFVNGWPTVPPRRAARASDRRPGRAGPPFGACLRCDRRGQGPRHVHLGRRRGRARGRGNRRARQGGHGRCPCWNAGGAARAGAQPLRRVGSRRHAPCARRAADRLTAISVIAEDVIAMIPAAIRSVADKRIPR